MTLTISPELLQNEPAGIIQNTVVTGTLGCSVGVNCDGQIEFVLMQSSEGTIQYIMVVWKVLLFSLLVGDKIQIIILRQDSACW